MVDQNLLLEYFFERKDARIWNCRKWTFRSSYQNVKNLILISCLYYLNIRSSFKDVYLWMIFHSTLALNYQPSEISWLFEEAYKWNISEKCFNKDLLKNWKLALIIVHFKQSPVLPLTDTIFYSFWYKNLLKSKGPSKKHRFF